MFLILLRNERKTDLYKQIGQVLKNNSASKILKDVIGLTQERIQIIKKEVYELEVLESNDLQ